MTIEKIQQSFDQLSSFLRGAIETRSIYYCLSPGNLGDALIRVGTERFLEDYHFHKQNVIFRNGVLSLLDEDYKDVRPLHADEAATGVLLYGGGGGWCETWTGSRDSVTALSKIFSRVIVLPSTYGMQTQLSNVTFLARDRFDSLNMQPNARFFPDLAFYLSLLSPQGTDGPQAAGVAFCFRKDRESAIKEHWKIPLSNVDLSWRGDFLSDPSSMLDFVSARREVHTDRLHVAIACCLTKTRCFLYPGNYFKNSAIFRSSIEPTFWWVRWRDRIPLRYRVMNSIERKALAIWGK